MPRVWNRACALHTQGCGFLCVTRRLPEGCGCPARAPELCNKLPACVHALCNLMQQGSCGPVSWGVGAWLVAKPQGLFDLRLWRRLRLGVVGLSTSGLVWLALPTSWSLWAQDWERGCLVRWCWGEASRQGMVPCQHAVVMGWRTG